MPRERRMRCHRREVAAISLEKRRFKLCSRAADAQQSLPKLANNSNNFFSVSYSSEEKKKEEERPRKGGVLNVLLSYARISIHSLSYISM